MRKKPKGRRYRNLFARRGVIYYQRRDRGFRHYVSTKTDDWEEAAAFRELYEEAEGIGSGVPILRRERPNVSETAERYLRQGMHHLAPSTREDRLKLLRHDGALMSIFGGVRIDRVSRRDLLGYVESVEHRLSSKTIKNHLDILAAVFAYAVDHEEIPANPVDAVRATLRRRSRSQRGRQATDPARNVRPLGSAEVSAFVVASRAAADVDREQMRRGPVKSGAKRAKHLSGIDGHVLDMLQLDAGLRLGEALGIRWGDIHHGSTAQDTERWLTIEETRARGRHIGPPKSGRTREVALSRRLSSLLRQRYLELGRPELATRIVPLEPTNYRARHFVRVCRDAEIAAHRPKDLRDTYASQLLTSGVSLGYVSAQLGHADVAITARHYARWIEGSRYREPMRLAEGEIPADLLARLPDTSGTRAEQA